MPLRHFHFGVLPRQGGSQFIRKGAPPLVSGMRCRRSLRAPVSSCPFLPSAPISSRYSSRIEAAYLPSLSAYALNRLFPPDSLLRRLAAVPRVRVGSTHVAEQSPHQQLPAQIFGFYFSPNPAYNLGFRRPLQIPHPRCHSFDHIALPLNNIHRCSSPIKTPLPPFEGRVPLSGCVPILSTFYHRRTFSRYKAPPM